LDVLYHNPFAIYHTCFKVANCDLKYLAAFL